MQSATAVQPQPQQAGQGGANYPMASLYVGDLGNIFLIIFSLISVPSILTDWVQKIAPSRFLIGSTKSRKSITSPPRGFWIEYDSSLSYSNQIPLKHDFGVANESLNVFPDVFRDDVM